MATPLVARAAGGFVPRSSPTPITRVTELDESELQTFAELVGKEEFEVRARLHLDPDLVPFAASATHARAKRLKRGITVMGVGFGAMGAGAAAAAFGFLYFFWEGLGCIGDGDNPGYHCDPPKWVWDSFIPGALVVAAAGLVVGLAGVSIVRMPSEEETVAIEKFKSSEPLPQKSADSSYSGGSPMGAPRATMLRLVSFSF